jgi:hypothetical protein
MLLENLRQWAERRVVGTEPGGLNKLVGQVDGSWYCQVSLTSSSCDHPLTLRLGGMLSMRAALIFDPIPSRLTCAR